MKAVLRIAGYFFAMVPLQKWLNIAGLVLLAIGFAGYPLASVFGVVLLCISPGMAGGIALRYVATRSVLHLRPFGRIKLVAGTTLALTAVAMLAAMPWIDPLWPLFPDREPSADVEAINVFLVIWSIGALWWIGLFAISFSYAAFSLMGLLPVIGLALGQYLRPLVSDPATSFLLCGLAWCAFSVYLLMTSHVRRPQLVPVGGSMDPNAGHVFAGLFGTNLPAVRPSSSQAAYLMLFGARPRLFAITGLWVSAIFLIVLLFAPFRHPNGAGPVFMLPFLAFFHVSVATSTVRRARLLWLRTGADRAALFSLAERWGLRSAMTTWIIVAALVFFFALRGGRFSPGEMALYTVAQAAAATALFYGGLALVRGWSVHDVVFAIAMAAPALVQAVLLPPRLSGRPSHAAAWIVAMATLALVLRWYAARQWTTLDWRVAKMPQWLTRTS